MAAESRAHSFIYPPYHICLQQTLSDTEQHTIATLLGLLPADCISDIQSYQSVDDAPSINIKGMVDGRGLACPMPLLKTKVALRNVASGESLYVVATDPNSQADITAFCQQARQADAANQLLLTVNQMTDQQADTNALSKPSDTIFHFIITKTGSN